MGRSRNGNGRRKGRQGHALCESGKRRTEENSGKRDESGQKKRKRSPETKKRGRKIGSNGMDVENENPRPEKREKTGKNGTNRSLDKSRKTRSGSGEKKTGIGKNEQTSLVS